MSSRTELAVAVEVVRAAARVCRAVRQRMVSPETLQKKDRSPVTVADFASQAVVCAKLERALPGDPVVGEEDAAELRDPQQAGILKVVLEQVKPELGTANEDQVLGWIDRGGADARGNRYWTLDPIDGTKGFLRGGQYAVALALIEEGQVVLGVLGCPSLPGSQAPGSQGSGVLMTAARGEGTRLLDLWGESMAGETAKVQPIDSTAHARFCESVESGHSDQDQSQQIARLLEITSDPIRIDSQCKYATVARGQASIYLRIPTSEDYREKIWDHAAGKLVVEEAGGLVTDVDGKPLDFAQGRTLAGNRGIIATCGGIHGKVVEAVGEVLKKGT